MKKWKTLLAVFLMAVLCVKTVTPAYTAANGTGNSGQMTTVLAAAAATSEEGLVAAAAESEEETTSTDEVVLKYFPVTLYNYDKETMNNATHQLEVEQALASEEGIGSLQQWSGIYFESKADKTESYTYGEEEESAISLKYAKYNWWTGNISSSNGNHTYSGIAQSTLDNNKNILFNYPDAGIFTNDTTNKQVYTGVEMPFVYSSDAGYYTFDAKTDGVYFKEDTEQGSSGTAESNSRLYYSDTPQNNASADVQDSNTYGWYPFNEGDVTTSTADYYFGMSATFPFTMTANGRMDASEDESEAIKFEFSGDDDVWVFIDGVLVLDIGGIHNRIDGTIDFAENKFEITIPSENASHGSIGDAGGTSGNNLSGMLFNVVSEDGTTTTGVLGVTREAFAATDSHDLTIFYLERGDGSSNCMIKFNLPVKDSVSVKKSITQSKADDGTVSPLTAKEQAMVDGVEFGFVLYRDDDPVANATYLLLNVNGQVIDTPSTDAYGKFNLKNGQTAKFVGIIDENTYYVIEDGKDGYTNPCYTWTADAAGAVSETEAVDWTSMKVSAPGSAEDEDNITFVCTNYLSENLPNPSLIPSGDEIVIDYGLPVTIPDVTKNDTWRGDSIELVGVSVEGYEEYGTAVINDDGTITYTLKKQLDKVVVLTYTAKVTGSGNVGTDSTEGVIDKNGYIYIIPATTMYYEESFGRTDGSAGTGEGGETEAETGTTESSPLVTYVGAWEKEGTAAGFQQEGYLVGNSSGASVYGSDTAYINNSGDSYGTSMCVDTTDASASFSYTFTGTGTSFFARTGDTSAGLYIRVTKDGELVNALIRNTIYKEEESGTVTANTLYNIPVYTYEADNYGTYTVTVTVMKANTKAGRGGDFYLDGIRIVSPLGETDAYRDIALGAYAQDKESNMTVATLRQALLADTEVNEDGDLIWVDEGFVVFTDSNGEIATAEEYKSNGPKEEVYLKNGQSVSFSLANWDANTNRVYLGIKAPKGGSAGSVTVNDKNLQIENTVDCYYNISDYAVISNDDGVTVAIFKITAGSNSLISVTNIKVTGNTEFVIVPQKNEDVESNGGEEE